MNAEELRALILTELARIAPEIEAANLDPQAALHAQVDLDSMDWLNFLIALHQHVGVDIPEADYARLGSLNAIHDYLWQKINTSG
ncbi:MAG: phosphopantetheine-binding protein [Pseudomonadales bacterium]|nr:phosphopantetheine-binding protein [Pseudomonadales bacterium]